MPLTAEQQKQLDELTKLSKEPEGPPAGVTFNLDLSNDAAWERAKKLGIIKDDPPPEDPPENGGDPPKRGPGYFGS